MKKALFSLLILILFASNVNTSVELDIQKLCDTFEENGFKTNHLLETDEESAGIETYIISKGNNSIMIYVDDNQFFAKDKFDTYYNEDLTNKKVEYEYNADGKIKDYCAYANYVYDNNYTYVLQIDKYFMIINCQKENRNVINQILEKNNLSLYTKDYEQHKKSNDSHHHKYDFIILISLAALFLILLTLIIILLRKNSKMKHNYILKENSKIKKSKL